MWRIFSILVALTLGTTLWLGYELGIFPEAASAIASEKPNVPSDTKERLQQQKDKELAQRESDVIRREQNVIEKERLLGQQLGRYEKSISELRTKLTELESLRDSRIENFRQIYEKMDSKKASKILDSMDLGLASSILSGMKGARAAEILAHMSSERARLITEKYLSKRTLATKDANREVNEVPTNKN